MKQIRKEQSAEISPELLERAKAGNRDALSELYEKTHQDIYRTVHSMIRDEDLTLDIQQDTYLKAFSRLDQLRDAASFLPWLRQIAVNEARAQLCKKRPLAFSELSSEEEEAVPELPDLSPEGSPELALDRKETNRLIREILSGLSDGQRMLLGMFYYEQLPLNKIAEDTGLSVGTIKTQLHRGRKRVETEVRKLEAQGVKLYGLSPMPFLLALMKRQSPTVKAGEAVLTKTLARAGAVAGAKAVAVSGGAGAAVTVAETVTLHTSRSFFETVAGRIVLGVIVAGVIGGGAAGYRWAKDALHQKPNPILLMDTDENLRNEIEAPTVPVELDEQEPSVTLEPEQAEPTESAEASKPTDHSQPTEPMQPTEPAEPTQPTEPTEPTEPSQPAEPSEPSQPSDPPEATEPSQPAEALASGSCGNRLGWTLDNAGLLTIEGSGAMTDYDFNAPWYDYCGSIRAVRLGYGVTHIGESAFFYCTALASVTIPSSGKSIGNDAFQQCYALSSVTIPDSVTSIGDRAFAYCALTELSIPASVTNIGYLAFTDNSFSAITVASGNPSYCSVDGVLYNKLKTELILYPSRKADLSYQIPGSVTTITSDAFYKCAALKSVTIPDSVRAIGSYAFFRCSSLTDIRIPDGVWQIETLTFAYCTALKSVTIGNSVNIIGCEAFSGCESLTSLVIPDSVTFIDGWAFDNCSALTDVTIGKNLQRTGAGIFGQCSSLTSVTIPDSMTQIKLQTFYNCVSLTSVIIPDSVTEIDQSAFEGVPVSGLTIFGAEGSAAQAFANKNGFRFEAR